MTRFRLTRDPSRKREYKYTVYQPDDRAQGVTLEMLDKMNLDQLLGELKELCKIKE